MQPPPVRAGNRGKVQEQGQTRQGRNRGGRGTACIWIVIREEPTQTIKMIRIFTAFFNPC